MFQSESAGTAPRRTRSAIVAALVVVGASVTGVLGQQALTSSSSAPPAGTVQVAHADLSGGTRPLLQRSPRAGAPALQPGSAGVADGVVRGDVTVFDDETPAVARLDPGLLGALRSAATAAAGDGVEFWVNSGWRSPKYQNQLLREAVAQYGSEKEAARWVATADTSAHVSGNAVDIGHSGAASWLSKHGAAYGLCQIYRNEPWHYELRPEAADHGCPAMYSDPTHDPRMHR